MKITSVFGGCLLLAMVVLQGCQGKPADTGSSSGESASSSRAGKPIQIKGSDTMVNLGQAWAEAYGKEHPESAIAVTGGGSGTGIAALINGTCDIAQSSRDMKPEGIELAKQRGHAVKEFKVALDALTVVVHPSNPVAKLTIPQLSDIFTGKVTDWNQVGGSSGKIFVISRERNSGTHVFFLEQVLRRGNSQGKEEYAASVSMLPSSQAIASEIATNPSAIGYFGLGYLDTAKQKAVAVAKDTSSPAVEPNLETATSGKYPISRPLYLYTPGEPDGAVKAFIEYAQSDAGQRIVKELDFVPLRSAP
jgi:phosphate transport system substrate-binding protein